MIHTAFHKVTFWVCYCFVNFHEGLPRCLDLPKTFLRDIMFLFIDDSTFMQVFHLYMNLSIKEKSDLSTLTTWFNCNIANLRKYLQGQEYDNAKLTTWICDVG